MCWPLLKISHPCISGMSPSKHSLVNKRGYQDQNLDQGRVGWFSHQATNFCIDIPNFQCKSRGLYPPPRNPYGLHWTPLDSTGLQWIPVHILPGQIGWYKAQSTGVQSSPVQSSPLDWHWTASHFSESSPSPVDWESSQSPVESSGLHWIPLEYCL